MIDRYFLKAATPEQINFFRVIYCTLLLYRITRLGPTLPSGTFNPLPLFEALHLGLMDSATFKVLYHALLLSLGLAAIGLWTRVALASSCLCFFLYKGTLLSFSKSAYSNYVWHSDNIVVMVLCILTFAPGIAFYGLDGLRQRRWGWNVSPTARPSIVDWASPLIIMTLGLAYFGSGYCKVTNSPLWADGYTLQAYVLQKCLLFENPAGVWLTQRYGLCLLLSIVTLVIELTFVLVVFFPRLTWIYVLGGLGLHAGIYATMKINFFKFFGLTYLIFLRWTDVQQWLRALKGHPRSGRLQQRVNGETGRQNTSYRRPEAHPVIDKPAARLFVASFIVMLSACIVLHIESWPFTDYGVYTQRHHYSRIAAYRLGGYDHRGNMEWLGHEYLRVNLTTFNHLIRHAVEHDGVDHLREVVIPLIKSQEIDSGRRFSTVVLIKRTVTKPPARGHLHIVDTPILQILPLPSHASSMKAVSRNLR